MGLVIENAEAERLLRQIQAATGERAEDILLDLLRGRASTVAGDSAPGSAEMAERRAALRRITQAASREATNRDVSDDALVGYDAQGLPQ